ncbi:MAG: phosphoribosylformylglycinamidine synthase, partial [bacterium]|nr:phosphoribosylformylglycinamidine synthase [bacterium]
MNGIKRIYVERKKPFDIEAGHLLTDLKENLGVNGLTGLRVVNRYDISGLSGEEYHTARTTVFSEPPVDHVYDETFPIAGNDQVIAIEYLPGQYDQRADSAAQCIEIVTLKKKPAITAARLVVLQGNIPDGDVSRIKKYLINPVDSREANLEKPGTLEPDVTVPADVQRLEGFIHCSETQLEETRQSLQLAMSAGDLLFCQRYFKDTEKRDPFITEIRMLDTYWSDHCRHTTFETRIANIRCEESSLTLPVRRAFEKYLAAYQTVYPDRDAAGNVSLMNIATMSMKELRQQGKLEDMEVSGEINACSIIRDVIVEGKREEWLVMFKNETHNHPTEIEPFGGAATCLGGAIRDPLSGRSFVYQAMRVTGSGNPLQKISETLPGKLPQRKITTEAAHGYSSYGNQIGLPTGQVTEIYHEGYIAKRMEVGAVIGAVPRKHVLREEPVPGDVILMVGGRTGRDGIGGATGSSKEHTEDSIETAGAEVQKGNPPEERKLQRLFRNLEVTRLIKKSNDFGAGGVSVAIGELADGLKIFLDNVPKKYEGLDGTELALSESQERMAVVVAEENAGNFKKLAALENLEATKIAEVTADNRLTMSWRDRPIVDISREFIATNGVRQETDVMVNAPDAGVDCLGVVPGEVENALNAGDIVSAWRENLKQLGVCSQQGLVERFDASVGGGTVLMPFGGKHQLTPVEAMAAKVPVFPGETTTASLMSFGFNPVVSRWSPFHGAVYAVVEAVSKIVATGGNYRTIRLSLQEYFEKLGSDPSRWGKPFSALLGAYHALTELGIAAIGGKDSMSGSFKELDVPPTLIAFAVDTVDARRVVSPEFKRPGSVVVYVEAERDKHRLPCFDLLKQRFSTISRLIGEGKILSARTVRAGGIAAAISEMAFGNHIGFEWTAAGQLEDRTLFTQGLGSFLLEAESGEDITDLFRDIPGKSNCRVIGNTLESPVIRLNGTDIPVSDALAAWKSPLETVFPTQTVPLEPALDLPLFTVRTSKRPTVKIARPRVLVTVFPGTNCEYETQAAFEKAGAVVDTFVFRNLDTTGILSSIADLERGIRGSQIIAIPGGFSSGDEPDGSGKFITSVFRNPQIADAVMELLKQRDGLMVGICNGFQALIKLGLVPYGEIRDMEETSPTLTMNRIGRHISRMVRTRVTSVLSPWFLRHQPGDVRIFPASHGEGRFIVTPEVMGQLTEKGQIATQYVDIDGVPSNDIQFNPNGAMHAVEGITSPDGRVLGKMGHAERVTSHVAVNIPGNKHLEL